MTTPPVDGEAIHASHDRKSVEALAERLKQISELDWRFAILAHTPDTASEAHETLLALLEEREDMERQWRDWTSERVHLTERAEKAEESAKDASHLAGQALARAERAEKERDEARISSLPLRDWVQIDAECALYVAPGNEHVLCDRLPRPVTLLVKVASPPTSKDKT